MLVISFICMYIYIYIYGCTLYEFCKLSGIYGCMLSDESVFGSGVAV